jgi:hypothetical protein
MTRRHVRRHSKVHLTGGIFALAAGTNVPLIAAGKPNQRIAQELVVAADTMIRPQLAVGCGPGGAEEPRDRRARSRPCRRRE